MKPRAGFWKDKQSRQIFSQAQGKKKKKNKERKKERKRTRKRERGFK